MSIKVNMGGAEPVTHGGYGVCGARRRQVPSVLYQIRRLLEDPATYIGGQAWAHPIISTMTWPYTRGLHRTLEACIHIKMPGSGPVMG